MGLQRKTREKITDLVLKRAIFKIGNISGSKYPMFKYQTGQLPKNLIDKMKAANPAYAVYSYKTPIAWTTTTGWYIPDITYSVTTSHHQGVIRVIAATDRHKTDI